jgi:glycosyltransferase involved in cell wall biosynthesis
MNIAIDGRAANWYRGTGIGTYTYQLINNLNQIDFLNNYLVFLPEEFHFEKEFRNNFKTNIAKQSSLNNFWEEIRVPNVLSENDMDLYHIPQNGVGLSGNISCKKVITLHDIIPLRMPETCSDRYLKIFNEDMPGIIEKCDGIITVSNFSKEDICKEFNFPREKIFVTYLAAEDIYKPLNKEECRYYLQERYGIEGDFLLYVGGFSPRKNILGLIEAFELLLHKHNKKLSLVVTGKKGISYETYKEKAISLGVEDKVLFTDFIPLEDMPIFYNAAKVFVYPSYYEGFGLPPLEAMACGTPVVASTETSIPEVCGDSALLSNPSSTEDICLKILSLLENQDLYKSLIRKGLVHTASFNWKKTAYDTLDAYKSI